MHRGGSRASTTWAGYSGTPTSAWPFRRTARGSTRPTGRARRARPHAV